VTPHYFPTVGATRAAVADHAAGEILHAALDEGGEAALEPLGFHQGTDVAGNLSDVVEAALLDVLAGLPLCSINLGSLPVPTGHATVAPPLLAVVLEEANATAVADLP